MAGENRQKIKLLKLIELLRSETDEEHPLSTRKLCEKLSSMEISCDRRTLSKDIALLNDEGFEVMQTRLGKENGYYIEDRDFSVPELKILIDAVQAASFITNKKTSELIEKIANLGGSHRAEILKSNLVCFNTSKHSNEAVYYNVGFLEEAIAEKKAVRFCYYDLNENREKVYRRNGESYLTEPVSLVFNEDNYYLIAYSKKHESTTNYRIDRMDRVEITDEPVSKMCNELRKNVEGYSEHVFKMYGGRNEDVVLEFDRKLIGVVFDKFGEQTKMMPVGENRCLATVKVQISPVFFGWLFQFSGDMKVLSPESVVNEYKKRAETIAVTKS